eukprot:TRINITY_DN73249_c0_g1_i1.p1 TRINITY_DN73249_c0_g1~~TRINITY_DN73249_c0_g1_i1.p1  ORF type:complete len:510 (+),score=112.10 TRINITY_DN73249_c0_g1_i1:82-1611(+)
MSSCRRAGSVPHGMLQLIAAVGLVLACRCDSLDPAGAPIRAVVETLRNSALRGMEKLLFRSGPYTSGVAGMHQFSETWARDISHASIGILARPSWNVDGQMVQSTDIVRDIVLSFMNEITRKQTLAPRVLDSQPSGIFLDKEKKLKLKVIKGSTQLTKAYELSQNITTQATIDSNYWLLRAFARYAAVVSEPELIKVLNSSSSEGDRVADKLRMTLGYLASERLWDIAQGRVFLRQDAYEEWKDSIKQVGVSSFTNLQFIETLEALANVPTLAAALEGTPLHEPRFGMPRFAAAKRSTFLRSLAQWKRDVVDVFQLPSGLLQESASVANMSHVDAHLQWFRVTRDDAEVASRIKFRDVASNFVTYDADGMIENLPGTPTGLEWPTEEVAPEKRLIGLGNYHGSLAWSWLVGSFAHEAHLQGDVVLRDGILRWLLRAQTSIPTSGFSDYISEVYSKGKILAGVPYTSETPFMWGSSYMLWATEEILKSLPEESYSAIEAAAEEEKTSVVV